VLKWGDQDVLRGYSRVALTSAIAYVRLDRM
jgi:hypothetical protein